MRSGSEMLWTHEEAGENVNGAKGGGGEMSRMARGRKGMRVAWGEVDEMTWDDLGRQHLVGPAPPTVGDPRMPVDQCHCARLRAHKRGVRRVLRRLGSSESDGRPPLTHFVSVSRGPL